MTDAGLKQVLCPCVRKEASPRRIDLFPDKKEYENSGNSDVPLGVPQSTWASFAGIRIARLSYVSPRIATDLSRLLAPRRAVPARRQCVSMEGMQRLAQCTLPLVIVGQLVLCDALRAPGVLPRAPSLGDSAVAAATVPQPLRRPILSAGQWASFARVNCGLPQQSLIRPRRRSTAQLMIMSEGKGAATDWRDAGGDGEPPIPKVLASLPKPPRAWLRWLRRQKLPLKWVVLGLLVVQNAATTILVQTTRTQPAQSGIVYLGGAAVLR